MNYLDYLDYKLTDEDNMTAGQKRLVLRDWDKFLAALLAGYTDKVRDRYNNIVPKPLNRFTNRLYEHLILHCGFIAHYSKFGFYQHYFEDPADTLRFMSRFDPRGEKRSVEYGGGWLDRYQDINNAMVDIAGKYMARLTAELSDTGRDDLAKADALYRKHGVVPPTR